jgi:proteasome accessory factor B
MNDSSDTALLRHLKILRALAARKRGVAVKEFAQEFGVSDKTIRRDLDVFARVGFLLHEEVEERGRKVWKLDAAHALPVSLTFDEALALWLSRHLLGPLAGTLVGDSARQALGKVRSGLGEEVTRYLDKMLPLVHATMPGLADHAQKGEILDRLLIGMEDRQVVWITYRSQRATEPVTYDVHPYGVAIHKGALYLIGFAPQHDEIRHWKMGRIEEANVDVMPFTMPAEFRLDQHLAKSFGVFHGRDDVRVKVRFSSAVARYVSEANWHASQKITPQSDGGLLAEFRLNSTAEIKQWVLSFGIHAEVLEPKKLREEMWKETAELADRYGKRDTPQNDSITNRDGRTSMRRTPRRPANESP